MDNFYLKVWRYWSQNWHWLIWVIFFLSLSLAGGLYQLFGDRWVDVVQGLLNFLTSPCMSIFIAIPIALAIVGVIVGALKK